MNAGQLYAKERNLEKHKSYMIYMLQVPTYLTL